MLTISSDSFLIQSYQSGDQKALSTLVHKYKERVFTSIYFLVKDKYLAEDIFQDTFIKIIDTINNKKYKEEGKFLSWAIRIAHNICMDHFRKINKTSFIQTSDDFNFLSNLPQRDRNIEDKFMQQETEKHLRAMLDTLREEQREVIILKHFANLSFKEIAELTNCSINTALGRMRYGLLQLRKIASTQPGLCH